MRALLSVSFGTSHADTRAKTIDAIEAALREAFPDLAFYSAWTSGRIIAKLKAERGERHDSLPAAFARMNVDGVDDLIVATTCLMQGNELLKATDAVSEWLSTGVRSARVTEPLLASHYDRMQVARTICEEFAFVPQEDALLLMGHGTSEESVMSGEDDPNHVYLQVQDALHDLGRERFFVGTVEGTPTFEDALALLEASGAKRVYLAPLMVVAGDHAKNDLAGDDDSWACRLQSLGYETEPVLRGLGEFKGIHQLVCEHVRDALVVREVGLRG